VRRHAISGGTAAAGASGDRTRVLRRIHHHELGQGDDGCAGRARNANDPPPLNVHDTRLAGVLHRAERQERCAAFLCRTSEHFAERGIRIEAVMTDQAKNYTLSREFRAALACLEVLHLTTLAFRACCSGHVGGTPLNLWEVFPARPDSCLERVLRTPHRQTDSGVLSKLRPLTSQNSAKQARGCSFCSIACRIRACRRRFVLRSVMDTREGRHRTRPMTPLPNNQKVGS
jgi:hypothetical protein